jgi:hypothetical protein
LFLSESLGFPTIAHNKVMLIDTEVNREKPGMRTLISSPEQKQSYGVSFKYWNTSIRMFIWSAT